jgi:hypothetical protein
MLHVPKYSGSWHCLWLSLCVVTRPGCFVELFQQEKFGNQSRSCLASRICFDLLTPHLIYWLSSSQSNSIVDGLTWRMFHIHLQADGRAAVGTHLGNHSPCVSNLSNMLTRIDSNRLAWFDWDCRGYRQHVIQNEWYFAASSKSAISRNYVNASGYGR